jgi:hypothetical protein
MCSVDCVQNTWLVTTTWHTSNLLLYKHKFYIPSLWKRWTYILGIQQNRPLTSIPSTGYFRARNAVYVRPSKLYVKICDVLHKETLIVLITKMATNIANYVNLVRRTILYYTILYYTIRWDADESLARPGRKQATATKLGTYSTYSPRNSIQPFALTFTSH